MIFSEFHQIPPFSRISAIFLLFRALPGVEIFCLFLHESKKICFSAEFHIIYSFFSKTLFSRKIT